MKNSMLLMRPKSNDQAIQKEENIFQKARLSSTLPTINKPDILEKQQKLYDFVGPIQFRLRRFFSNQQKNKIGPQKKQRERYQNKDKNVETRQYQTSCQFTKIASTTINRETMLSKLQKHQQKQASKQKRNIDKHKQYQLYWNKQGQNIKRLITKKRQSLIRDSQRVIVEDNPDKNDIINDNVVHYWEMSLRNHNPILKKHIKGHRYDEVELQKLLQSNAGIKEVESSIPKLPLKSLKKINTRELSLTGRSKSVMESQSLTERSSFVPFLNKNLLNQEEVYLISYDGEKKWQGTQNFF